MGRTYDHRIKMMIAQSRDPNLFPDLGIPVSTAKHWIRNGVKPVVTLPDSEHDTALNIKAANLEKRVAEVEATHRLVVFTFKIFGLQIQYTRLPTEDAKTTLIAAINDAAKLVPIAVCLEAIGLSAARFRAWCVRQRACRLADQSSCPQLSPTKLTVAEAGKIRDIFTSPAFAHFSLTAMAMYAKRQCEVFASPATWARVIRRLGLKRRFERVHPAKPRFGIRASAPFQIWHLDLTVIRLIDGSRVFVQAVIDNFSRYVLAARTTATYGGSSTKTLLLEAIGKATAMGCSLTPTVMVDSGSEKLNGETDGLVDTGIIKRVVAQIDIQFSNSMIEAFFRRMKHGYLFLQRLTSIESVANHVTNYLAQHNEVMPHSSLRGATPFEAITGVWGNASVLRLDTLQRAAAAARLETNRASACLICQPRLT